MAQRVTIGGLSALVERPVSETAPPLLFVHGYFGRAIEFERMMACLAAKGHLCCAVDLCGHGDSAPKGDLGRLSIHDYADDVERVAREMGRPIIVGHSMGGLIAQVVATRDRASAIVLLAPAPPRGISIMSLRLAIAQIGYMPSILLSRPVIPDPSDLGALVVNRVPAHERDAVLATFVPDSGRAGREMTLLGVPVDRSRVRVPMLLIAGDQDRFIPLGKARRIAARYGAKLLVAPGRGHMLVIEPGYDEICEWIAAWIPTVVSPHARVEARR